MNLSSINRNSFANDVQKDIVLDIMKNYLKSPYGIDNQNLLLFGSKVDIIENNSSVGKFVSLIDSANYGNIYNLIYL